MATKSVPGIVFVAALHLAPCPSSAVREALRPMQLTYSSSHRGDHPPWDGIVHVSIERQGPADASAWSRTFWIEHKRGTKWNGTTLVSAAPAQLESVSRFDADETRFVWQKDRVLGESKSGPDPARAVSLPIPGPLAVDFEALDLVLPSLPLADGYKTRIWIMDFDDQVSQPWSFRPFSLSATGPEAVQVPAGTFTAFRVTLMPLDGNQKMSSTFHIQVSAPRLVVRKAYVVNAATSGRAKQSNGTEELTSIRLN